MTLHFLKRDFRDFLLYWIILLILTIIALLAGMIGLSMLVWAYFMFPSMAEGYILGSPWRTQHQMSRHYLLSLPISHKRLFVTQQIRILVFWMPLLILMSCVPFTILTSVEFGLFYYFAVFVSIAFWMHSQIWSALEMESISTYLPKGYRIWAYIKLFGVLFGTMAILATGWVNYLLDNRVSGWAEFSQRGFLSLIPLLPAEIVFTCVFVLLIVWVPYNARRWCVTL